MEGHIPSWLEWAEQWNEVAERVLDSETGKCFGKAREDYEDVLDDLKKSMWSVGLCIAEEILSTFLQGCSQRLITFDLHYADENWSDEEGTDGHGRPLPEDPLALTIPLTIDGGPTENLHTSVPVAVDAFIDEKTGPPGSTINSESAYSIQACLKIRDSLREQADRLDAILPTT